MENEPREEGSLATMKTWKKVSVRPNREIRNDELEALAAVLLVADQWDKSDHAVDRYMAATTARERRIAMTWVNNEDDLALLSRFMDAVILYGQKQTEDIYINGIRLTRQMIVEQGIVVELDENGEPAKVTFPVGRENGIFIYPLKAETELGEMYEFPSGDRVDGSIPEYLR